MGFVKEKELEMKLTRENYEYVLERIKQIEDIKDEIKNWPECKLIMYELELCKKYKEYFETFGEIEIKDEET